MINMRQATFDHEAVLNEIRLTLCSDEIIAGLLLDNTAGKNPSITIDLPTGLKDLITLKPFVSLPDAAEQTGGDAATFISIQHDNTLYGQQSSSSLVYISIVCSNDVYMLSDGGIRPLRLAKQIYSLLDGKKLQAAGNLKVDNLQQVYYNNNTVVGYNLMISYTDSDKEVIHEL